MALNSSKQVTSDSRLTCGQNFERLADLTELEVGGGLVGEVLLRVQGQSKSAICLCDLLEAGLAVNAQNAVVVHFSNKLI